jgi:uncharacterized protein YbjT (DUF2867 family)
MRMQHHNRRLLLLSVVLVSAVALSPPPTARAGGGGSRGSILVVGASGGTGQRALQGLLDVGYTPQQLVVLTRSKEKMQALQQMGFSTIVADLDDPSTLVDATRGCVGCYIHSTASDTKALDTAEVERARHLAAAMTARGDISHVVYNSAAGEEGHGVYRIEQKHKVEKVFLSEYSGVHFTSLRANLFMEELWKGYTRPSILKGKYPFSIPSNRHMYLTSVRDMGRLAGACLNSPDTTTGRMINVASAILTPHEMADAFSKAQGTICTHDESRIFALIARFFLKDLFEVIRFYRTSTETTDIEGLEEEFPGLLTSFGAFLEETNWSNPELAYDDLKIVQTVAV